MTGTGSLVTLSLAADATPLYDRRRAVHYAKPRLRGWLHLVWFGLCLVVAPLTLVAQHSPSRILPLTIYLVAVTGLFGTSALYHRGRWSPPARARMQRLDHVMIFVLIAGTATPEFLLALPGALGRSAVIALWSVVAALAALHLRWMNAPERLVGAAFLVLGWGAGLALPAVWVRFGVAPVALIAVGGVLYTVGALAYHRRRPDPFPTIFGYHEVFHALVCAAATCRYVAIVAFIA